MKGNIKNRSYYYRQKLSDERVEVRDYYGQKLDEREIMEGKSAEESIKGVEADEVVEVRSFRAFH